jgi:ElaB/YqjD/DUF883 family membrane-anchored ribosome-binding protein
MTHATTRQLLDDIRTLIADAEALATAAGEAVGERADDLRHSTADSLGKARTRLEALEEQVAARAKAAADGATDYVRENPWTAIGIAAAVGVVVGVLIGRR